MRKGEREERLAAMLRAVLVVGIVLALAAASYFPFSHFLRLSEARSVLYSAKLARLSAWSVSAECYGAGKPFSDFSAESGFAGETPERIRELCSCEGEFRLLQTDETGYEILCFSYTENGYTAVYRGTRQEGAWQVYRNSELIAS